MKAMFLAGCLCLALMCHHHSSYGQTPDPTSQKKQTKMKQFSLLVRVPETYSGEQARQMNPEWDKLLAQWKADGVYVISFAFPGESFSVTGSEKLVKRESILSGTLRVVSNLVVRCESIDEAVKLAQSCPVLAFGGSVEVREIPKPITVAE